MTPGEKIQEAKRLRAEGQTLEAIADRLGVSRSTAWRWCNNVQDRRIGSRAAAKRAADEAARHPCSLCGKGRIWRQARLCVSCLHEEQRARRREIEHLWNQGKKIGEIAATVGATRGVVGATISKMRAEGYDLPYRRTPEQLTRILAGSDERLALARASRKTAAA